MKYIAFVAFIGIVGSLGTALFFMMRGGRDDAAKSRNMARALALRIGLSVLLFICLLVAWKLGWVNPTGIPVGR